MFRDTLRDLDEGDACSEASDAPEDSPKERRKAKRRSLAAAGRVPTLDLLRIWDTGASQGMVDKAVVSSKNAFVGDEISVCTGNGTVSSKRYERCDFAPGVSQVHVALPNTANTVSMGSINTECRVGFQWLQPLEPEHWMRLRIPGACSYRHRCICSCPAMCLFSLLQGAPCQVPKWLMVPFSIVSNQAGSHSLRWLIQILSLPHRLAHP